jgi:hypothetical protein
VGVIHFGLPISREMAARTQPGLLDLMIALAGGAAGAYAAASPRISAGLVGVAIATALVPPLTTSAMLLAWGEYSLSGGAFLLFVINLLAIQFATSTVLCALGYHKLLARAESVKSFMTRNAPSAVLLTMLGVGLFTGFQGTIEQNRINSQIRDKLEAIFRSRPGVQLTDLFTRSAKGRRIVIATVRTPFSFTPEQVAEIERVLPVNPMPNELHIRSVLIKEADARRYLHEPPSVTPTNESENPSSEDLALPPPVGP